MLVYVVVTALVFAEDALFVGFVLPGETAAVLVASSPARDGCSVMPANPIAFECHTSSRAGLYWGVGDKIKLQLSMLPDGHQLCRAERRYAVDSKGCTLHRE